MKLLSCNGRTMEVRDVSDVLVRLTALPGGPPIKAVGDRIVGDDAAREELRALRATGLYGYENLARGG